MSEPLEVADHAEPVVDGVWTWRISNGAIGGETSSSHAIADGSGGVVLVDPVRLADDALAELPRPTAIALTARTHQRAAWRYRAQFGAPVWAPEGATGFDEEPDHRYDDGDELPGGLVAVRTPGPEPAHFCFVEPTRNLVVCSDLVEGDDDGAVHLLPPSLHDDPAQTRADVEGLVALAPAVLCLDHGSPVTDDPAGVLAAALREARS